LIIEWWAPDLHDRSAAGNVKIPDFSSKYEGKPDDLFANTVKWKTQIQCSLQRIRLFHEDRP